MRLAQNDFAETKPNEIKHGLSVFFLPPGQEWNGPILQFSASAGPQIR